jgi:signal transduction histidine kinase
MKYFLKNNADKQISNLEEACKQCLAKCEKECEKIYCPSSGKEVRIGKKNVNDRILFLCSKEDIKSRKVFEMQQLVWLATYDHIFETKKKIIENKKREFDRLFHNLISLNTRTFQAIDKFLPEEDMGKGGKNQLQYIEEKITEDPKNFAKLLLRVLKNEKLVSAEFTVYDIVYKGKTIGLSCDSAKKIIFLVFNTFLSDLNGKNINWHIDDCEEAILVDFSLFSAGLLQIFDNISKYILEDSDFYIKFRKNGDKLSIILDMVSLKIKDDEKDNIFKEGVSGYYSIKTGKKGKGLGLYTVKKLFNMNKIDIDIRIDVDHKKRKKVGNIPFENNQFIITVKRCS